MRAGVIPNTDIHAPPILDLEWIECENPPKPRNLKLGKSHKAWNLAYPRTSNWNTAKHKMLVVIEHVPTPNLHSKRLLSHQERLIIDNIIRRAFHIAKQWAKDNNLKNPKSKDWAWWFVSWANFKTYDLKDNDLHLANEYHVERMRNIIAKLKPTKVHYFGEEAAYAMHGIGIERRAWVLDQSIKKHKFQASSNLSFTRPLRAHKFKSRYSEEEEFNYDMSPDDANLLGHISENLARLILGSYPYSLSHLKPIYELVNSMKAWKKLLKRLWKVHHFSLDLETFDLSIHNNGIVTAQFSFDSKKAYIVPLKCVNSPWQPEELKSIYTDMQALFGREISQTDWDAPYIIGQNLAFDFRVLCVELGLHTIQYRIWDTMAASYSLDENLSRLLVRHNANVGTDDTKHKPWALDAIFARFENDFYFDDRFSKDKSPSIATSELTKDILKYCAMDCIAAYGIHDMQLRLSVFDGGLKDFKRRVLGIWSDTTHVISQFIRAGTHVDREYVVRQHGSDTSDIDAERERLLGELYDCKAVKKANKILRDKLPKHTSIFAGTKYDNNQIFDISSQEHKRLLFFEVLGLEPLDNTPTGKASMGKPFKKHYGNKDGGNYVREVELWDAIEETVIVRSNIRAYYQCIHDDDGIKDDCVHASYGYLMVVTGRSNSFNPNLQNAPNHGQYAKLVKRAFCARPKHITIKVDFSTHEVACWCQQSGDKELAQVFKRVRKAELQFLHKPTKKNAEHLKLSDVHRINYSLFTDTPVDQVTPQQRQSSKGLTFGAIYGESVRTVANRLGIPLEEMQEIYNRFFGKFPDARRWLDWSKQFASENLYTFSQLGHRRHLYGYLTELRNVMGAMDRRAMNSPIQGFASQLLFMAARLFHLGIINKLKEMNVLSKPKWDDELGRFTLDPLPIQMCQSIHDSLRTDAQYDYISLATAALQYYTTEGLMGYTNKMYGIDWIVEPRVDFEIGDTDDTLQKWNGTDKALSRIVKESAIAHKQRGCKVPKYDLPG